MTKFVGIIYALSLTNGNRPHKWKFRIRVKKKRDLYITATCKKINHASGRKRASRLGIQEDLIIYRIATASSRYLNSVDISPYRCSPAEREESQDYEGSTCSVRKLRGERVRAR